MNYNLAKKLKIAGLTNIRHWFNAPDNEMLPEPLLEELIEACGDKFCELSKGQKPIDHAWTAQGYPIETMYAHGDTPEEAVSNLYLKIKS